MTGRTPAPFTDDDHRVRTGRAAPTAAEARPAGPLVGDVVVEDGGRGLSGTTREMVIVD